MSVAMGTEGLYQFRPLTRRKEIRLLQVLPDTPTARIKCEFETGILRRQPWMPHYTAISYTWGSANRDASVLLEGNLFNVTTSAFQVLLRIRRTDKPFLIWIDSICINQDDNEEKSKQIQLMGQIYSMASETVAWIGKTEGDSALAISAMKSFGLRFGSPDPSRHGPVLRENSENILRYARSETGSREWKAIARLLSRGWFHRVWVLQEVALSKRLAIYCGEDEFLYADVSVKAPREFLVPVVLGMLLRIWYSYCTPKTCIFTLGKWEKVY